MGDVTAQGNLIVDTGEFGTIILLQREAGDVRLAASAGGGVVQDEGLDFVAGGEMIFIGTLELGGVGELKPQFATPDDDLISKPPIGDKRFIVRQMSEFPDLIGSVLDAAAAGRIVGTDNGAGVTEALAGALAPENYWLQLLTRPKPIRNPIDIAQWEESAAVLEELKIKPRYLCQDEILRGRAFYDDYSEVLMPGDSSGWITANRMDPVEIKFLAKQLRRFLTQRKESFHQGLLRRNVFPVQEEISFQQDLSQLAVLLAIPDQIPKLTSWEKEQLAHRILLLVKPQEFDLAEFREMISHF